MVMIRNKLKYRKQQKQKEIKDKIMKYHEEKQKSCKFNLNYNFSVGEEHGFKIDEKDKGKRSFSAKKIKNKNDREKGKSNLFTLLNHFS